MIGEYFTSMCILFCFVSYFLLQGDLCKIRARTVKNDIGFIKLSNDELEGNSFLINTHLWFSIYGQVWIGVPVVLTSKFSFSYQ